MDVISKKDLMLEFHSELLNIIDPNGIMRHIDISDIPVGRNVDEVIRLVKAFK